MTDTHASQDVRMGPEEGGELDLKDVLAQLLARKYWILFAFLVGATVGAVWGQLPPSVFQSSALVQIEKRSDRIQLPAELIGDLLTGGQSQGSGLETEVHIIRSRLVLKPVIERLYLQTKIEPVRFPFLGNLLLRREFPFVGEQLDPKYALHGENIDGVLIDIPQTTDEEAFLVRVLSDTEYELTLPNGTTSAGTVGEELPLPNGGQLLVSDISAPVGREYVVQQELMRNSVNRLSQGLAIRERGSTGIVDFSYKGTDSGETTKILNAVIDEYMSQNLRRNSAEIDRSIGFIEEQLREVSDEIAKANSDLIEYRKGQKVDELSASTQDLLEAAVRIEARIEELAFQREQLLQVLTVNHPDIRTIDAETQRLEARLGQLRTDLERIPEVEQELAPRIQRLEQARVLEQQLTGRIEQLRILQASAVGNIRVLEPAEFAKWIGPDRRRPILIGGGLGFLISVLFVLAANFLRRGIEDARDIENLGLPLFATVNKVKELKGIGASQPTYGLAVTDPSNMAVEALRGLRTGLKFSLVTAKSKSIMITSCAPSDGKSFIALNLAIVTAQAGLRVLLVDADLRRGFLRKYFDLKAKEAGLTDLLMGSDAPTIQSFPKAGIDFIATGQYPPNPAELLDSTAFSDFLDNQTSEYDLVIVDAPPVFAATDAAIIGQKVGMSLLVVRHLQTTPEEIVSAQKSLSTTGVKISGVVLNQFDSTRSRYGAYGNKYGYYYGGYQYKYARGQK